MSSLGSSSSTKRRRRDAEKRLAYSGMAICLAFGLCVLPMCVVAVLSNTTSLEVPSNLKFGVFILSWFHAVINPILYGFLNPQYRAEYRKMMKDTWAFLRCKGRNRTGFGRGAARSAIVKQMRQQYESPNRRRPGKRCKCIRGGSLDLSDF